MPPIDSLEAAAVLSRVDRTTLRQLAEPKKGGDDG